MVAVGASRPPATRVVSIGFFDEGRPRRLGRIKSRSTLAAKDRFMNGPCGVTVLVVAAAGFTLRRSSPPAWHTACCRPGMKRRISSFTTLVCLSALLGACSSDSETGEQPEGVIRELKSSQPRDPAIDGAENEAVSDLSNFAWSFYRDLEKPRGNFVYSPYSIAIASAMLSAGAAGDTLSQLRSALRFSDTGSPLHEAQNALLQLLQARNREGDKNHNPQLLRISSDFWMHPELTPESSFLDTLAQYYGAGVHLAAFETEPEECRRQINAKIALDTGQLIGELLPPGSIDPLVVFVLTNALYFKAHWKDEFDKASTRSGPFTTLDGGTVDVALMHQETPAGYFEGDDFFAVSLPYDGDEVSMVFLVPELGTFEAFVSSLDAAKIQDIVDSLQRTQLDLALPKFALSGDIPLAEKLRGAGMIDAFDPDRANFSRIASNVFISNAFHQAKLVLDEQGTEAAAATAFVGSVSSIPPEPTPVVIDRPFLFFVRDATGAALFIGQLATPE
jgi:serpin B